MIFHVKRSAALILAIALLLSAAPSVSAASAPDILKRTVQLLGGEMIYTSQSVKHPSAGLQEERILVNPAGSGLLPVVVSGSYNYNDNLTITEAYDKLRASGYEVVAGVNGDFFNTTYLTPTGLHIDNGILKSWIYSSTAIGFDATGKAKIGAPSLKISLTAHGESKNIETLNIVRTSDRLCLYTTDFADTTKISQTGMQVILSVGEQVLRVGGTVQATVREIKTGSIAHKLTSGEMVLAASGEEPINRINNLKAGDQITISVTAPDSFWTTAVFACGGLNRLVIDGKISTGLGTSASPRTGIGIKADGSLVVYTCDGRQSSWSKGISLNQMAQRLSDLGCVNALELDGGGSTAMLVVPPGQSTPLIVNKPSDGKPRKSKNYIFFINPKPATGELGSLHLYGPEQVLSGETLTLDILAADTAGHAMPLPADGHITLTASSGDSLDSRSILTYGTGEQTVTASILVEDPGRLNWITGLPDKREVRGTFTYQSVGVLDGLSITREDSGASVTGLFVNNGETVSLNITGTKNQYPVFMTNTGASWHADAQIGTIDENGVFTAGQISSAKGNLTVSAGGKTLSIPVHSGGGLYLLEDFENELPAFTGSLTAGRNFSSSDAAYGKRAVELRYDFTVSEENTLSYTWTLTGSPAILSIWVRGDGSQNRLFAKFELSEGGTREIELCTLSGREYNRVTGAIPAGVTALTGFTVRKEGETTSGVFMIDHIMTGLSDVSDTTAPKITLQDPQETGEALQFTGSILDGSFPLQSDSIIITLDGIPISFLYDELSGALAFTIPAASEGTRLITLTAMDRYGNYARRQWELKGEPIFSEDIPPDILAADWSRDMLVYLYQRGALTTKDIGGTESFEPLRPITRLEILEMLLPSLGIDPALYADAYVPLTDIDTLAANEQTLIRAAYRNGVMRGQGMPDGTVIAGAYEELTRADFCVMMMNIIDQGIGGEETITFSDEESIPGYARPAISRLTAAGILKGTGSGAFEPLRNIPRADVAQVIYRMLF